MSLGKHTPNSTQSHLAAAELRLKQAALEEQAKRTVLLNNYIKYFQLRFKLGKLGTDAWGVPFSALQCKIDELKDELKELKKANQSPYVWLTININPAKLKSSWDFWIKTHALDEKSPKKEELMMTHGTINDILLNKALKFANSAPIDDYVFVWEQRRTADTFDLNDPDMGQHFHFIIRKNPSYCYSKQKSRGQDMWRKLCNVQSAGCYNSHNMPESFIQDKIDYINGKKKQEGKLEKVKQDRRMRQLFNFREFYFKETLENPSEFRKYLEDYL